MKPESPEGGQGELELEWPEQDPEPAWAVDEQGHPF